MSDVFLFTSYKCVYMSNKREMYFMKLFQLRTTLQSAKWIGGAKHGQNNSQRKRFSCDIDVIMIQARWCHFNASTHSLFHLKFIPVRINMSKIRLPWASHYWRYHKDKKLFEIASKYWVSGKFCWENKMVFCFR